MSEGSFSPQQAQDARDDLAALALGATDPAESLAARQLIASDSSAARTYAEFEALAEALLYTAPVIAPPPALEARLRVALAGEAPHKVQAPAVVTEEKKGWSGWFGPASRPAWAFAVGAVLLLVLTNLWWSSRPQGGLDDSTQQTDRALTELLTGGGMETTLPAAGETASRAHLYWEPSRNVAVLLADSFPQLEPGQTYQIWLIEGENRTSGGLFKVDEQGFGMTMIRSDKPLEAFDALGITPEPEGGSPGPTAPPVVRGPLEM